MTFMVGVHLLQNGLCRIPSFFIEDRRTIHHDPVFFIFQDPVFLVACALSIVGPSLTNIGCIFKPFSNSC